MTTLTISLSFSYLETCSQIDRCFCLPSGLNLIVHFRTICYSEIYSMLAGVSIWHIVINEIRQISWKNFDFPKFRKLQEVIWLNVIIEIFKFPPHFEPFGYVNYLDELYLGYPNYPTQKWYIWASFQTSRKRFRKLQKAILICSFNFVCYFESKIR